MRACERARCACMLTFAMGARELFSTPTLVTSLQSVARASILTTLSAGTAFVDCETFMNIMLG